MTTDSPKSRGAGCVSTVAAAALACVLLPLLAGCPHEAAGGGSNTEPRKGAGQAAPPPAAVPPEANQPGPQADPGQCTDRGKRDVSLHATWDSETRVVPEVSYTKNGIKVPAANLSSHRNAPGHIAWGGEWSALVTVVCHDALALDVVGNSSQLSCLVTIVDLGNGPVKPGTRTCHVEYLVP